MATSPFPSATPRTWSACDGLLLALGVDEFLRRFLLHLLPPGFVRIRNFGFLANRNRATLLPLFGRCWAAHGGTPPALAEPSAAAPLLILELPCLWGNHARRRTPLRSSTAASLSASTGPGRSMKLYLHPRPLPVLQHACRFFVSSARNPRLPGYPDATPMLEEPPRRSILSSGHRNLVQLSLFQVPLHPLRPIQST